LSDTATKTENYSWDTKHPHPSVIAERKRELKAHNSAAKAHRTKNGFSMIRLFAPVVIFGVVLTAGILGTQLF